MPSLPVLSGAEMRRVLEQIGWIFDRQAGSHMIMVKEGSIYTISVPNHSALRPGTLKNIMKSSGLSNEDLHNLLK